MFDSVSDPAICTSLRKRKQSKTKKKHKKRKENNNLAEKGHCQILGNCMVSKPWDKFVV